MPESQSPELQQSASLDFPEEALLRYPNMPEITTGAMVSLAFQLQAIRCRDLKLFCVLMYTILSISYCANVDLHSPYDPGDGQKCRIMKMQNHENTES